MQPADPLCRNTHFVAPEGLHPRSVPHNTAPKGTDSYEPGRYRTTGSIPATSAPRNFREVLDDIVHTCNFRTRTAAGISTPGSSNSAYALITPSSPEASHRPAFIRASQGSAYPPQAHIRPAGPASFALASPSTPSSHQKPPFRARLSLSRLTLLGPFTGSYIPHGSPYCLDRPDTSRYLTRRPLAPPRQSSCLDRPDTSRYLTRQPLAPLQQPRPHQPRIQHREASLELSTKL
jgi:hypothetical protein